MNCKTSQDSSKDDPARPAAHARSGSVGGVLHKLVTLVDELCDAVDREEVDIGGGRGSLTILREIGPLIRPAQAALATSPASSAPTPVPGEGEGWREAEVEKRIRALFEPHVEGRFNPSSVLDAVRQAFAAPPPTDTPTRPGIATADTTGGA